MNVTIDAKEGFQLAADAALWPRQHARAMKKASDDTARTARSKAIKAIAEEAHTLSRRVRRQSRLDKARIGTRKDYARVWIGTENRPMHSASKKPDFPAPNPPMFKTKMPSGARGWFYRHPTKRMLSNPNRAAVKAIRVDLTPFVARHLPAEANKAWKKHYRTRYEREFSRLLKRT